MASLAHLFRVRAIMRVLLREILVRRIRIPPRHHQLTFSSSANHQTETQPSDTIIDYIHHENLSVSSRTPCLDSTSLCSIQAICYKKMLCVDNSTTNVVVHIIIT